MRNHTPQRPLSARMPRHLVVALALASCLGVAGGAAAVAGGTSTASAGRVNWVPRQQPAPSLAWHSFLGGTGDDESYVYRGIAVDALGNVYVTGSSDAPWGSPIREHAGGWDAFVAALSPSGALRWNTFLGGTGDDRGFGIAVDSGGDVYVVADSNDTWGSPVRRHEGEWDVVVTRLSAGGDLTWNTFLGGEGDDYGDGIAVDAGGSVYVVGDGDTSWGSPVRAHGPGWDAFTARLTPAGVLRWNMFLGATAPDSAVSARGVAVDASGTAYVVGSSSASWGRPVRRFSPGTSDAYAAAVTTLGELRWNTFLGSAGEDYGDGITVDDGGSVYVVGDSDDTWEAPVRAHDAGWDTFAAALTPTGAFRWNTFVGGSGDDDGDGVAVDGAGRVYVVGDTSESWGEPLRPHGGAADMYAAALAPGGAPAWHMFLGGADDDEGRGVTADAGGNVFVVGLSAGPWGEPVHPHSGGLDEFVAQIAYLSPTATPTEPPTATATPPPTEPATATATDTATTAPSSTATATAPTPGHRAFLPVAWQRRP